MPSKTKVSTRYEARSCGSCGRLLQPCDLTIRRVAVQVLARLCCAISLIGLVGVVGATDGVDLIAAVWYKR